MDTYLWGPLLWRLLESITRVLNPAYLGVNKSEFDTKAYKDRVLLLLYSLRYVLPCVYCRESYRRFISNLPPEEREDLWVWVWDVHELVNKKLDRPPILTLEKYEKRLMIWPTLLAPYQLWTLLTLLVLNYPKKGKESEDEEFKHKRCAYYIFFNSLTFLLPYIAGLENISTFISVTPTTISREDLEDRSNFCRWLTAHKNQWANSVGINERALEFSCGKLDESLT